MATTQCKPGEHLHQVKSSTPSDEAPWQQLMVFNYVLFEALDAMQQEQAKRATVMTSGYPPLKTDSAAGAWRKIPWINLRGHWLEQVGFKIGTPYTITAFDKQLIFTAE